MNDAEIIEYLHFMQTPENERNCPSCPENKGFSEWPGHRLPCGQFHCWVTMHCKEDES